MNPGIRKWLVRSLVIVVSTLVVLAGSGFILLSTQQERLVNLAVEKLNKEFKGELEIGESTISIFKNFPAVSIVLHNGRFYSDKTKRENPIAQFDKLYVGFSMADILNQQYNITSLFLQGGYLDLILEKDGTINLLEAKSTPMLS
jgi:hypothetical protein